MTRGSKLVRDLASRRSGIEQTLRGIAGKINALDRELSLAMAEEGRLWNQFAAIQIGEASDLPVQIEAMLDKRQRRIESEQKAADVAARRIADLEKKRKTAALLAQNDDEALREQEKGAQATFDAEPGAVSLRVEITSLEETAESLSHKLRRATDELEEKRGAYEKDEFFTYLMKRGFGTPDYVGWGMVRRLDGWLANLVSYRRKAGDYRRLHDIPAWIEQRLAKVSGSLETRTAEAGRIRERIFSSIASYYEAAGKSSAALAGIDREIEKEQATVRAASAFISDAALAADEEMKKATRAFSDMLSRKGIRSLAEAAAKTASKQDDEIVLQLDKLAKLKEGISAQIDSMRPGMLEFEKRARAIEEIESKLRSHGWTGSDDSFSSRLSESTLDELANGMITASAMWSVIQSAHQRPQSISYGGSSSGSSSWGSGGGFGGGSSGGGFGGGGSWSSGGGFGGGGASTGGGF